MREESSSNHVLDWTVLPLGQVTGLIGRGSAPSYVEESNVLAIGQRCIRNGGLDTTAARRHDDRVPPKVVPEFGDVLLNSTGTGTIGRSCVFDATSGRFMVDGHVTVVRAKPRIADGRILNEVFRSADGQRFLESHCFTGSTNQVELSVAQLRQMPIQVPPLPEQRRIGDILDTVDDTIRATERVMSKQIQKLRGITDDAVHDAISAQRIVKVGELVDSSVRGLVQSGPFGSQLHASDYVAEGVPTFMPTDIRGNELRVGGAAKVSAATAASLARHLVEVGDLILPRRGDLSKCAVVDRASEGGLCGTGCLLLRVDRSIVQAEWLAAAYRHEFVQRQVAARAVGSTMVNLSGGLVRSLDVPLPQASSEGGSFLRAISSLQSAIAEERAALHKLRCLRVGLSRDLLSGRVRKETR
jgi:type I restriction enzyme S subunit